MRCFVLFDGDGHAVDAHLVLGADEDAAGAVDDAGGDQIGAGGIDADGDLRHGDLHLLCVQQVPGRQVRVLAKHPVVALLKSLHLFPAYAALAKDALHLPLIHREGLGDLRSLMLLHHGAKPVMDGMDHLVAALLGQGVGEQVVEGFHLHGGGHGRRGAEDLLRKGALGAGGVFGIIEGIIEIGGAFIEGGEQKARFRRTDDPVGIQVGEGILPLGKAEGSLRELHRADAAKHIAENLAGLLRIPLAVPAAVGHVIGVIGQKDEIVALYLQGSDGLFVKTAAGGGVVKLGAAQRHKQAVLVAVRHLGGSELNIHQVLPQLAGEGLAQRGEEHLPLLLPQHGHGLLKLREDLPPLIHITAIDPGNIAFIGAKPSSQLRDFFFCHKKPLSLSPGVFCRCRLSYHNFKKKESA